MFHYRMRVALAAVGLLAAGGLSAPVLAETSSAHDASWGQSLHEESCAGCHKVPHDAAFYQARRGGKIGSSESLRTMVQGCVTHFGISWFDEEVDAVTAYLDKAHYRFADSGQVRTD